MEGQEKLNIALDGARAAAAAYKELAERSLPPTIKAALADGWELNFAGMPVEIPDWIFYGEGERKLDRQRVIPMREGIAIMGDLEQDFVDLLTRSRLGVLIKKINRMRAVLGFLVEHGDEVWEVIKVVSEALYANLSGINWRRWWSVGGEVAAAVAAALAAVTAAAVAAVVLIVIEVVRTATDAASPVVWGEVMLVCNDKKRERQKRMGKKCFPQRQSVRFWRRKAARL